VLNPFRSPLAVLDPGEDRPPTDLETIQQREDLQVVPLRRNDRTFLAELPSLGRVASTTANACTTCTLWGQAASVSGMEGGDVIFDHRRGLRWIGETWRHSIAAFHRNGEGRAPCLMLFSEYGELVHRIALDGMAGWAVFASLVKQHQGCMNCLKHTAAPVQSTELFTGGRRLIRDAWQDSQSSQDLDSRIEKLGLDRLLAIQAMDGLQTSPIAVNVFAVLLDRMCAWGLTVHLHVGNRCCTQFLECILNRIERSADFWKLYATDVVLRIELGQLDSVWLVDQAGTSDRQCLEGYDFQGMRVFSLSCPRNACPAIKVGWQRLQLDLGMGVHPNPA
jgi:putative heme degradation protein